MTPRFGTLRCRWWEPSTVSKAEIELRNRKAAVRTGGSQDYVLSLVRWGELQFAVSNIALWVEG
jgi:hypothetical protein